MITGCIQSGNAFARDESDFIVEVNPLANDSTNSLTDSQHFSIWLNGLQTEDIDTNRHLLVPLGEREG